MILDGVSLVIKVGASKNKEKPLFGIRIKKQLFGLLNDFHLLNLQLNVDKLKKKKKKKKKKKNKSKTVFRISSKDCLKTNKPTWNFLFL
jgi:hypothetical protein